jgi:hypothetical protein
MSVYIGFDSTNYYQELAYNVCLRSIKKYNNMITTHKIVKKELENNIGFVRKINDGSTEFTYTRFLTPLLNNYKGWALFCDSDFLWFCDIDEIFKTYCDNKYAVYCVKHEYSKVNSNIKLNGKKQEWYPRKNWSSLMLFNCSHPSIIANMTLYNINTKSPQWLHRMEWCNDEMIGSIDIQFNYLVGYYNTNIYKVLHYTDGIPAYPMYRNCMYSDEWYSYLTNEEKQYLFL